jgi:hypothetical protein
MVFALSRVAIMMDPACWMPIWKSRLIQIEIDIDFCAANFNDLENLKKMEKYFGIKCVLFFCTKFFETYFSPTNISATFLL